MLQIAKATISSSTFPIPSALIHSLPSLPALPKSAAALNATAAQIFSHPTWDLILIFAMVAIGFFYGLSRGRHKMVSSVLNTYIALAIFNAVSIEAIARYIKLDNLFIVKIAVFFVIFLPLAFLLNRGRPRYFRSDISWWQVFLLSFIQTGLLIHIIFSFFPPEIAKNLAPFTRSVFANTNLTIWWLIIPLIFMIFLRRSGRDD